MIACPGNHYCETCGTKTTVVLPKLKGFDVLWHSPREQTMVEAKERPESVFANYETQQIWVCGDCGCVSFAPLNTHRGPTEEEEAALKARIEGYRSEFYTGDDCENCGRARVEKCNNGKRICEKCHWDQDSHDYDGFHLDHFC